MVPGPALYSSDSFIIHDQKDLFKGDYCAVIGVVDVILNGVGL